MSASDIDSDYDISGSHTPARRYYVETVAPDIMIGTRYYDITDIGTHDIIPDIQVDPDIRVRPGHGMRFTIMISVTGRPDIGFKFVPDIGTRYRVT